MYEETKSSIDWKGLILKVIIVFLLILIGFTIYTKVFKNNNNSTEINNNTEITDLKNNETDNKNLEKLRTAGKNYFEKNKDSLPTKKDTTTMVTLKQLIEKGFIVELKDNEGKVCDKESSYVTATKDGESITIRVNLVCGVTQRDTLTYLNNTTSTTEENKKTETNTTTSNKNTTTSTTITNNNSTNTTTNNSTTNTTTNKNTSTNCNTNCVSNTCTGTCVPSVTVNTNVSQNVTINKPTTKPVTTTQVIKKYTVKFDSNGGNEIYANQIVNENKNAVDPGTPKKTLNGNQCTFKGWYLNGSKFDFKTPITKNITLVAYYSCPEDTIRYTVKFDSNGGNIYYNNQTVLKNDTATYPGDNEIIKEGYTCTFKGWYLNNKKYDFETPVIKDITLKAKYSCVEKEPELITKTMTTKVYSMGWNVAGTNRIEITHYLRVPEKLESLNVEKIRIKDLTYNGAIDSLSEANTYKNLHDSTFLYAANGWEYRDFTSYKNFATISSSDVGLLTIRNYKDFDTALSEGFKVIWGTDSVTRQCSETFSVNGVSNLCAYGIYYTVTWEYQLYE